MTAERSLATILFTDIVGSTERAAELGDERWRHLLERHHELVRRWLKRFSGHEVKTAGDGFLVTFDSPAMALACADAIRNAVAELDLGVRCGLHIGEIERKDGDVGGLAVHIGARVADLAGPGEVCVSSTVRDAEAGSGFRFEDRGRHELKGVPGEWRIHVLTGVPEEMRAALLEAAAGVGAEPGRWSRIGGARLVRVGLGYALAATAVLLATDFLVDRWGLPGWAMPAAIALLAIGLVVLAATAWAQSNPLTPLRAAAGEVPRGRAVDVGGLVTAVRKGELPHLTWGRAVAGGVLAFALLFGFAGLWVVIQDRGRSFSPTEAIAEDAAPGLAVLPFSVQGADLEVWREGMVDLLSTNLDGAAGLRSIDSRTVLARWSEAIPAGRTADLASAIEVGRRAGARYVLLGSAVSLGSGVRLSAEVYDVDSAEKLGQAQVVGAPDSVFRLVDALSIDVLRAILQGQGREGLPSVNLARVTTTSLPALKAYLEGEALFRRGEFDAAVPLYERAVEADSTFALALYRLGMTYGWAESVVSDLAIGATERAARYADRLPEREAVLVRAERALIDGTLDGIEPLERAVRRYPDDLEAWYLLGDTYFHLGDQALEPPGKAEDAFARAVRLDPRFLPAYIHRVDDAFSNADSARVLSLYDSMTPIGSDRDRVSARAMYDLAFGDAAARESAWSAIDTLGDNLLSMALQAFRHPRFRTIEGRLYEIALAKREPDDRALPTTLLAWNRWERGKMAEALATMDRPDLLPAGRAALLYKAWLQGLPVPDERLERGLAFAAIDPADGLERALRAFYTGAYAADQGREADRSRARGELRDLATRLRVAGDSTSARFADGAGRALDGLLAWQRGDLTLAAEFLDEARIQTTGHGPRTIVNLAIRWKLGELMVERGRLQEAERYFASIAGWHDPMAHRRLGDLYVEMEAFDKAREAYELFLTAWSDPDPALEPIVVDVRQKLAAIEPLRIE